MRRSPAIEAAMLVMAAAALRSPASAQDIPRLDAAAASPAIEALQLEVWINNRGTGLVASVTRQADGRLLMTPDELRAVGLATPRQSELVDLSTLPGLSATYDEDGQRLMIDAAVDTLLTQRFDLGPNGRKGLDARQDFGAVVNYAVSADGGQGEAGSAARLDGVGLAVDSRIFGRFGALDSAFSAAYASGRSDMTRLDTTWSWYSPRHALNVRAGDYINAGFSWTRPIRMAGLQFRRDFSTRPDLITLPSPRLSASAAAPSILDLYVNGVPVLSRRVGAGPIQVDGLPPSQGFSQARLVLRDEAGRQTTVTAPFFTTPLLLRKGFVDYSAEAGVARRYYGVRSNDYAAMPLATGSVRYGLRDGLTLEGHAEVGAGLSSLGGGFAAQLSGLGVAGVSVVASQAGDNNGALASAVFDSRFAGVYISAMALQASAGYRDLAAATSEKWAWRNGKLVADLPPRAVRQLTLSAPLNLTPWRRGDEPATLSIGYSSQQSQDGTKRAVWNGSLRHTLDRRITLYATGYMTRGERRDTGLFLGVAIPLAATTSATIGAETQGGDTIGFVEASKAEDQAEGAAAWRLRIEQGASSKIEAQGAYRGRAVRVSAAAQHIDGATRGQVQMDGAVAWLGGGAPMAANRLDGAFAVVDVGAPGVPVLFQNQKIGRSDRQGRLVVRNLSPFDDNKIAIDPQNLSLDLEAADTERSVAPVDGGGVLVRFGVAKSPPSALVTLRLANGQVAPAGAEAVLAGTNERVIVGYDGQTFLTHLRPSNDLTVYLADDATCVAHFDYAPTAKGGPDVVEAVCH
jgi:outer membrane usher protein